MFKKAGVDDMADSEKEETKLTPSDRAAIEAMQQIARSSGFDVELTDEERKWIREGYGKTFTGQMHAFRISLNDLGESILNSVKSIIRKVKSCLMN